MNALIIGRIRSRKSGLSIVTKGCYNMLREASRWDVSLWSDNAINWDQIQNYDVIILAGDSSTKNRVFNEIRKRTKAPIIALSLIRNSSEDSRDIQRLKDLNANIHNVYFAVWDSSFYYDDRFRDIRKHLISLPKPLIAPAPKLSKPFGERRGICIGHGAKTFNKRFSGKSKYDELNDIELVTKRLIKQFPKVPFYVYGGCDVNVKGLKKVNPGNVFVSQFLPKIKIFLSLQSNETFYMVPIEAQGVGTPVIYRHMPQSVTPYIGDSGLIVHNIEDIIFFIDKLYDSKPIWDSMSRVSIINAESLSWSVRAETMGLKLENLVRTK